MAEASRAQADAVVDGHQIATQVLRAESQGLLELSRSLDENFTKVLRIINDIPGRLVVTGMGKSGHIARKIAATLASTGRASLFVHPAEAGHGDLGMITCYDGVLALSNSGETAELRAVVSYTRRFLIPLIAMTSVPSSSLAKQSDALLQLPALPEACPLGLAPTTSTTMMLALGDALAVALFANSGFSHFDFQALHPGGSLGKAMLLVSELMHQGQSVPTALPQTGMADVILEMTAKRFGCVAVVDSQDDPSGRQQPLGIITDGDLRRHMNSQLLEQSAGSVMKRKPHTIEPHKLAVRALGIMNRHSITNLLVVEDRALVGIIHLHDCLRAGLDRSQIDQSPTSEG